MKTRHKRLSFLLLGLAALGVASVFVLNAFNSNLVFFFSPSQVAAKEAPIGRSFRIGGMVETGSLKRESNGLTVNFVVTDTAKTIGVVAQGKLTDDGVFRADEVLAKHDENYMPPEAAEALKHAKETNATISKSVSSSAK